MGLLAGVSVFVRSEEVANSAEVTNHPTEDGVSISDHTKPNPQTISITGVIQGDDAKRRCEDLEKAMNKGEIVSFENTKAYLNMAITSFEYKADKSVKKGYSFDASLQKMRIAKSSYTKLNTIDKTQVSKTSNAGRKQAENQPSKNEEQYHTIRKGQTFYGIAPKYGTTWQKIVELNPNVDPRALQIGQEVRVV